MTETAKTKNLGFLTVVEHPKYGLVGGYLILNAAGRPLEFHCTSPVRANRAQEILYGETLQPYLYGEQIAGTLIARAKTPIDFVITDVAAVLAVQETVGRPIGYVFSVLKKKNLLENATASDHPCKTSVEDEFNVEETLEISEELNQSLKSFGIENSRLQCTSEDKKNDMLQIPSVAGLSLDSWKTFKIGHRNIAIPGQNDAQRKILLDEMKEISRTVDLAEPFTRIRLAIEEAQRAA